MITGPRHKFEERLRQRGKTWEEVRACVIEERDGFVTVDEKHPAYPHRPKEPVPPGPGSWLKWLLSWFGIVASHGCKCNKMAKKMNEQGGWWCLTSGRSEILGVMKAEAEKRKLTWRPACVNVLIFLAVLLSWIETAILWDTGIQDTKRK